MCFGLVTLCKAISINRKMFFHLLAGIGFCVQPLYIGEFAPKHLRGGLAMGTSIFLTGGILTGQIIGLRQEMLFFFPVLCYSRVKNSNFLLLIAAHSLCHCSIRIHTRSPWKKKILLGSPYPYNCQPSVLSPQGSSLSLDGSPEQHQ